MWRNMDQNENQPRGPCGMCVQKEPCQGQSSCLDEPLQDLQRVPRQWCGGPCDWPCGLSVPLCGPSRTHSEHIFISESCVGGCAVQASQTRLYMVMTQYTMENTRAQAGGPSVSSSWRPRRSWASARILTSSIPARPISEIDQGQVLALIDPQLGRTIGRDPHPSHHPPPLPHDPHPSDPSPPTPN